MQLIDADAVIDRYYAEYEKQDICDGDEDRDWLKKCIEEAPTISPESLRPKGRWLDAEDYMFCSKCGMQWNYCDNDTQDFNYCPNCGAVSEILRVVITVGPLHTAL